MSVTAKMYGKAIVSLANREIDWDTDTIKVALVTSSYTPDQDAHDYFNDITNELSNGNGYTSGGFTLANKTTTYDAASNTTKLDADDVSQSGFTGTFRTAIIYRDTGTPSTSPLIGYLQSSVDITGTAGPLTLTWDAAGIFTFTVA